MLRLFTPKSYISGFQKLDIAKLKKLGIKVLLCDIDNTLVAHDEPDPSEEVKEFLMNVHNEGFEIILISNNVTERVIRFAKGLPMNVKTYPFAKKPLKLTYQKILRENHLKKEEVAVLGDQLLTDVLGANRVHLYTVLTHPVAQKDLACTKINRIIENMVFYILKVSGKLTKGKFDDEM